MHKLRKKKSGKGEEREENFALIRLQQSDPLHSSEDLKLRGGEID